MDAWVPPLVERRGVGREAREPREPEEAAPSRRSTNTNSEASSEVRDSRVKRSCCSSADGMMDVTTPAPVRYEKGIELHSNRQAVDQYGQRLPLP